MSDILTLPTSAGQVVHRSGQSNLAIDFGGSVIKAVRLVKSENGKDSEVHFYSFPRIEVEKFLEFLRGVQVTGEVYTTGVGMEQYSEQITECMGKGCFRSLVRKLPKREIVYEISEEGVMAAESCLRMARTASQHFAIATKEVDFPLCDPGLADDFYKWTTTPVDQDKPYQLVDPDLYPCLLVILGSAAPILKVDAVGQSRVVGNHKRAGRTLLALASLLLGVKDFLEMINLAERGDSSKVDSVYSDFGSKPEEESEKSEERRKMDKVGYKAGLKGDLVLFTFAKAVGKDIGDFQREDMMRALLCHVISDLADYITATAEINGVKRVYLAGSLVTHALIRRELTRCLGTYRAFSPKSDVEYNFLQHGGHYGALGALFRALSSKDI